MTSTPGPQGPPQTPPPRPGGSFFDGIRRSGWYRPEDRWIGGVCAAVAARTGWDVALVRGVTAVLSLFFGLSVLAYGAAWLLLPEQRDGRIHLEEAIRGHANVAQAGGIVLVIAGLADPFFRFGLGFGRWNAGGWDGWSWVLGPLLVVLIVAALASARHGGRAPGPAPHAHWSAYATGGEDGHGGAPGAPGPQPAAPQWPPREPRSEEPRTVVEPAPRISHPLALAVLGVLVLLAAATLWWSVQSPSAEQRARAFAIGVGAGLLILALVLAVSALQGRRGGWLTGLSVLLALTLAPAAASNLAWRTHTFDESLAPWSSDQVATNVSQDYRTDRVSASMSNVELDLREAPNGLDKTIPVDVSMGSVTVYVRSDQPVRIRWNASMSNLEAKPASAARWIPATGGLDSEGTFANPSFDQSGGVTLDTHLSMSSMTVVVSDADASPSSSTPASDTPTPTPTSTR